MLSVCFCVQLLTLQMRGLCGVQCRLWNTLAEVGDKDVTSVCG